MAVGPSSQYDSSKKGMGGIRLPHTTSPNWLMGPRALMTRVTTLLAAHDEAAASISPKPSNGMCAPCAEPMRASPQPASTSPPNWCEAQCSFSTTAANTSVKNACDCNTSDASPVGMPSFTAVNKNANCPTDAVKP
jgi:hypothetical protein